MPDGSLPFRLLGAAAAFALAGHAAASAISGAARSDLFATAARLEAGRPVDQGVLARLADEAAGLEAEGVCHDDVVRAGMVVALADLDRGGVEGFDRWAGSTERTLAVVRHATRCNPADGLRWALLAAVEQSVAEEPERLARLLDLSWRRSPAEIAAVSTRSRLWGLVSDATRARAAEALASDLPIFLHGGRVEDVAAALAPAGATLREMVLAEAAGLSPRRRTALARAGLDWLE